MALSAYFQGSCIYHFLCSKFCLILQHFHSIMYLSNVVLAEFMQAWYYWNALKTPCLKFKSPCHFGRTKNLGMRYVYWKVLASFLITKVLFYRFVAEMIPHVYEMALKQNPQSEELYSHLFMAYVRIGDYKKQQQVQTLYIILVKVI